MLVVASILVIIIDFRLSYLTDSYDATTDAMPGVRRYSFLLG